MCQRSASSQNLHTHKHTHTHCTYSNRFKRTNWFSAIAIIRRYISNQLERIQSSLSTDCFPFPKFAVACLCVCVLRVGVVVHCKQQTHRTQHLLLTINLIALALQTYPRPKKCRVHRFLSSNMTTLKHSSRTKPLALRHPNSIQSARTRALSCIPRISQPLASWPTKEFRICLPHALRSPEIKLKFVSKTIWLDGTDACWCGNGRSRSCFCNFSFRHLKYSECVHIENKLGVSRDCARTLRNGAAALAFNYQTTCKCFCTVASETECLRVCAAIPYN